MQNIFLKVKNAQDQFMEEAKQSSVLSNRRLTEIDLMSGTSVNDVLRKADISEETYEEALSFSKTGITIIPK